MRSIVNEIIRLPNGNAVQFKESEEGTHSDLTVLHVVQAHCMNYQAKGSMSIVMDEIARELEGKKAKPTNDTPAAETLEFENIAFDSIKNDVSQGNNYYFGPAAVVYSVMKRTFDKAIDPNKP